MKVLIFDGDCSFCNFFVRLTVKINQDSNLKITDFNTAWTKENYEQDNDIDSVIYLANGKAYVYSDAVLHLLADANRYFKPVILLKLVPKFIRDSVYKVIAKYRKRIPVKSVCERPTEKFFRMYLE